jgi:hypothetical protein
MSHRSRIPKLQIRARPQPRAKRGGRTPRRAVTAVDRAAMWGALHNLVYGGEFAVWMRCNNPALPFAAAREYDEAATLMVRLVGRLPCSTTPDSTTMPLDLRRRV